MKTAIYKFLKDKKFTSLGKNGINHKQILKAVENKTRDQYIEIYKESFGFTLVCHGNGFMNNNFPMDFRIFNKDDFKEFTTHFNKIKS
jgi:hypothetical protein